VYGPDDNDAPNAGGAAGRPGARLAPDTTLGELAELLRGARVFVGGDSGPMHLACAVGCPVVALYGPTDPKVNEPWGVPFVAVFPPERAYTGIKKIDRSSGGFSGVEPGAVEEAIRSLLRTTAASRR
jgi:ADP-heptose:LPS heptosyltransferase